MKLKILYASTSPFVNTGYGKCTKYIVHGLKERGFDIILYTPQLIDAIKEINGILHLGSSSYPYDVELIYTYYRMFNRNLLITHWDVWVLTGLTQKELNWVPYLPIDAELDQYTLEINNVVNATNVIAVVCQSKFGLKQVSKILEKDKPIFYVPHGVDLKIFKPCVDKRSRRRELQLPEDKVLFIFVGLNLSDRKGIPELIKAFSIAVHEYPDIRDIVMLILWTNINPSLGQSYDIPRLVRRYGIEKYVFYPNVVPPHRFVSDEDLAKIMSVCDWFITCTMGEGFNLPLLESLACGVPIVAPRHSTHIELVWDMSEYPYLRGLLYPVFYRRPMLWTPTHQEYYISDPNIVAEYISYAVDIALDEKKYQQLSKHCREFTQLYSWDRVLDKWVEILKTIEELI